MKLSLHLGAHKTATTYIQQVLRANRSSLAKRGIAYVPLNELRDEFSGLVLRKPTQGESLLVRLNRKRKIKAFLKRQVTVPSDSSLPPVERLILSEENLIGTPSGIVSDGQLYREIGDRLSALREHVEHFDIEVFLGVRHQGYFSSSVFAEAVTQPTGLSHNDSFFREEWLRHSNSWVTIIDVIRDAFPEAPILVWDYDEFSALESRVLSKICGAANRMRLPKRPADPVRQTFSHKAITELLAAQEMGGPDARLAKRQEARLAHPRNEDNPAFSLWSDEQLEKLGAGFQRDLEAISGMGNAVTLLSKRRRRKSNTRPDH